MAAPINSLQRKLLIGKESENHTLDARYPAYYVGPEKPIASSPRINTIAV